MREERKVKSQTYKTGALLLLLVALGTALLPVYWLATISLKQPVDQFAVPPMWIRFIPTLAHLREILVGKFCILDAD